jgi:hypothetical protein
MSRQRIEFSAKARASAMPGCSSTSGAAPCSPCSSYQVRTLHSATDAVMSLPLPVPLRNPVLARPGASKASRSQTQSQCSCSQPSRAASMARMARCTAWSTAITPQSMVANPGAAGGGQERSDRPAPVDDRMGGGRHQKEDQRLPRRPALAHDREEQQGAHDQVVGGDMGGQRGPGAGLRGCLPVGLSDPVAQQVLGEHHQEHGGGHATPGCWALLTGGSGDDPARRPAEARSRNLQHL